MARISGNVDANGNKTSNTGKHDFTSTYVGGDYRIEFSQPFDEMPTVLAHEINYDYRATNAPLTIRIVPNKDVATFTFLNQNTGAPVQVQFGFAAFGD